MGHLAGLYGVGYRWQLTIVGGVREAWSAWLRGRLGRVCARGACPTWSSGPSTSPLDALLGTVPSALRVRSSWGRGFHSGGRRRHFDHRFLFALERAPRLRLAYVVLGQRRFRYRQRGPARYSVSLRQRYWNRRWCYAAHRRARFRLIGSGSVRPSAVLFRRRYSWMLVWMAPCSTSNATTGRLTIVGGGREAWSVWRRGRLGTVCARGACPTWSSGPSTSPLDSGPGFVFAYRKPRRKLCLGGTMTRQFDVVVE